MFTGIIDHTGLIKSCDKASSSMRLRIETEFTDLKEGESISTNGVCLTVVNPEKKMFECVLSDETCRVTTAKRFAVGQRLNLERAMQVGDRFGGHYVTGHVDEVCVLEAIEHVDGCVLMRFKTNMQQYLIEKGSVCLNGVSLTLNKILKDGFEIMLIPHTLSVTNLDSLTVNDEVNIEYDWMVKVIVSQYNEKNLKEVSL